MASETGIQHDTAMDDSAMHDTVARDTAMDDLAAGADNASSADGSSTRIVGYAARRAISALRPIEGRALAIR